jgi:hypothetical protein
MCARGVTGMPIPSLILNFMEILHKSMSRYCNNYNHNYNYYKCGLAVKEGGTHNYNNTSNLIVNSHNITSVKMLTHKYNFTSNLIVI